MTVDYSEQANQLAEEIGLAYRIIFIAKKSAKHYNKLNEDNTYNNIYYYVLTRLDKTHTFKFKDSINNYEHQIKPNLYDLLATLQKYSVESFKSFVEEYGYAEIDSIKSYKKAKKIYKACKKEYKKVLDLFGDVMDKLREIN